MPALTCTSQFALLSFLASAANNRTITTEGAITPSVAMTPPGMPPRRYPTKVALLTAMGPGVTSAMATMSVNSARVSQPLPSIISDSIRGNMA
ncbi:MAG: hypothetical protein BWY85_01574 [Firmicutes bacterium ADurb.Bin506]|nr:MAG: hypothetical protein BWY85_01574 [Firmicutes bacterium ADurb.Bin506]